MSLIRESLKRLILQRLSTSSEVPPGIDINTIFEASIDRLKQVADEIKSFHQEKNEKQQLVECSAIISFEKAVRLSGQQAVLSKWAEARFKEFFVKRNEEDENIIDLYAQTSSGNLFMWDSTTEKWKKVK